MLKSHETVNTGNIIPLIQVQDRSRKPGWEDRCGHHLLPDHHRHRWQCPRIGRHHQDPQPTSFIQRADRIAFSHRPRLQRLHHALLH